MPHAIANFTFDDEKYYFYTVAKDSKDIIGRTTQIDKDYFELQDAEFINPVEAFYITGVGKVNDSIVVTGLKPGDMVYILPSKEGINGSKEDKEAWISMLNEINEKFNDKKKADAIVKKGSTSAVYYFNTKPDEDTKFYIGIRQAQHTSVRVIDGTVEGFIDRAISKIELLDVLKVATLASVDELDYFIAYNPTDKNSLIVLTGLSPGTYVALYDKPDSSKPVKTLTVKKGRDYAVFESITLSSREASFWIYISTTNPVTKETNTSMRYEFNNYDNDDIIDDSEDDSTP